jgi:hypothetical protein
VRLPEHIVLGEAVATAEPGVERPQQSLAERGRPVVDPAPEPRTLLGGGGAGEVGGAQLQPQLVEVGDDQRGGVVGHQREHGGRGLEVAVVRRRRGLDRGLRSRLGGALVVVAAARE